MAGLKGAVEVVEVVGGPIPVGDGWDKDQGEKEPAGCCYSVLSLTPRVFVCLAVVLDPVPNSAASEVASTAAEVVQTGWQCVEEARLAAY